MKVGLISYQVGHLKTKQLADLLLKKGYEVVIFAFPFYKKNKNDSVEHSCRIEDRPSQLLNKSWEEIYSDGSLSIIYLNSWGEDSIKYLDKSEVFVYLHCVAKILPKNMLMNRLVLNCHPGLLPQNRGVDSLKWSIVNIWPIGITLHAINEKIDSGLILVRKRLTIYATDTLRDVFERAYNEEVNLLSDFELYLVNISQGFVVDDSYSVSHTRVSAKLDQELDRYFMENIEKYVEISTDLTFHHHPLELIAKTA